MPGVEWSRAPLRISFAGGGTDLEPYASIWGGLVVSVAITFYCRAELRPGLTGHIGWWQSGRTRRAEPVDFFGDFVAAVMRRLGIRDQPHGSVAFAAQNRPGSGLGLSSASLVVLVDLLSRRMGLRLPRDRIAELAAEVERDELGLPGGLQDYYPAVYGGLNWLRFSRDGVELTPLVPAPGVMETLESGLLLCDTGVIRGSSSAIVDQQRRMNDQSKPGEAALHGLKRLAEEMGECLMKGDIGEFGPMLDQAWQYKKQVSPLISTSLIDEAYRIAREAGASGGKLAGAGGGGYLILYCEPGNRAAVRRALSYRKLRATPVRFDHAGLRNGQA